MYNNTDESHKHMLNKKKQNKEHVYYYFIMLFENRKCKLYCLGDI